MKQKLLLISAVLCSLWLALACEQQGDFGPDESTLFDIFLIDTLQLEISTVHLDSLVTQGSNELLLGQVTDPILGSISPVSYFQVTLGTEPLVLEEEDRFDSLALVFYPYQSRYGNGGDQVVDLYRIFEEYEPEEDFFYQFDQLTRSRGPIASFILEADEDEEDSVFVRVDSRLGAQIYRHAVEGTDALLIEEEFFDFLQGFSFSSSDPAANAVHSIPFVPENIKLQFFYTRFTEEGPENLVYEFPLATTGLQFNQVNTPEAGSVIKHIKNEGEVSTKDTRQQAYVQGGTALATRIRIPGLLTIREALENAVINTAFLEIIPLRNSYDKGRPLPPELSVHYINKFDNINSMAQLGDLDNTTSSILVEDLEFEADTHYEIDVRDFISDMIRNESLLDESLLVTLPPGQIQSNLQSLAIDASRFKTRLKIFISNFKD